MVELSVRCLDRRFGTGIANKLFPVRSESNEKTKRFAHASDF